ncbi:addiction module antidote protein [Methylomonas rivi]|uniref:Addiction module antidote protein n=1 Tax=Methylomonas rivi TaxID=2952226 RepID=A0ABT1U6D4_9GAMM|nr:addiction module antidote protein [Methylomonas sp. WSC-6]MCQ8129414.1 putative addiction module antidote protein [Methylomonas sp. WSC-6]
MTEKIQIADLPIFDITEHLDSDQAIAEYLTVVLEEDDPAALANALGSIARARGMTEIANAAGISREALYKALRADAQPRFETIAKVCKALGVKLTVQTIAA